MRKILALAVCLGINGCSASKPNDGALCTLTEASRADLIAGLLAHPETPDAVGIPAVDLLVTLSVCPQL